MLGFRPGERGAAGRKTGGGVRGHGPAELAKHVGLNRSIDASRGRTWLASGEGMSLLPPAALRRLHDFLRTRFDRITIAAAIRPPAGYMASAFQEPVKQGARDVLNLGRRYRSYRRTFEKFDEVFGRDNVLLWKYDPDTFPNGCAVQDFCRRLDIALPPERTVRVNESLSREAMGLLFTYRKLGKDLGSMSMSGQQNAGLVRQLMGIGSTRFRFAPAAVQPVLAENREDIDWMERRLGASLAEDLGAPRQGDVREEADLLVPDPQAVRQLLAVLGARAPAGVEGGTPREVAVLVHALREDHAPRPKGSAAMHSGKMEISSPKRKSEGESTNLGDKRMKASEVIEQLRQANPSLLEGIPLEKAEALLNGLFKHINATLARAEEGVVEFHGLGRFRVRKVQREVDGKKVNRTQILFRPREAGDEKGGGRRKRRKERGEDDAEE
jgi:hypothetical protein